MESLVGILPVVFVVRMGCNVLPLEKSIGCEEPSRLDWDSSPPPRVTSSPHLSFWAKVFD